MIRFLLSSGKRCPPSLVKAVEDFHRGASTLPALVAAHGQLARLVAPAAPATVRLMDEVSRGEGGRWSTLGAVKLVRQMMVVAIVCVMAFVGLSLFRHVGSGDAGLGETSGVWLFVNELFWMAAAGMGASFAILFQVNQYIGDRTYDPTHAPSYWIKLLLGVIAGFILVALVPFPEPAGQVAVGSGAELTHTFSKPLIAMLGGFSASAVYGLLTRLVQAVESLLAGSPAELSAARTAAAVQRVSGEAAEGRIAVAGRLVQVQQALSSGGPTEEVARRLQEVIDALVTGDESAAAPPQEAAEGAKVPAFAVVSDGAEEGAEAKG